MIFYGIPLTLNFIKIEILLRTSPLRLSTMPRFTPVSMAPLISYLMPFTLMMSLNIVARIVTLFYVVSIVMILLNMVSISVVLFYVMMFILMLVVMVLAMIVIPMAGCVISSVTIWIAINTITVVAIIRIIVTIVRSITSTAITP